MRRVPTIRVLLTVFALSLSARAQEVPPAAAPSAPAAVPAARVAEPAPFHRVFPPERASNDARLKRPAATLETPVSWQPPADPITWIGRQRELTERIRLAAGLWPYTSAALDILTHTVHDRGDYTVENVIFQGHYFGFVPANIYRPKEGAEKKPIVICTPNHDVDSRLSERTAEEARRLVESGAESSLEAARYPMQARCVQLARMGCIVVTFDAPGFGEYLDYDHQNAFPTITHALRAQNVYGLQLWNAMMALNHLWNSDGTDRERVGLVGVGSGATQALLLAAIEKRVKATFLAGTSLAAARGECRCEHPSNLRVGTSNLEFAAAIAPRALGVVCPESARAEIDSVVLPPLKKHWRTHGDAEDVSVETWPGSTGALDARARQAMYAFFNEHLALGLEGPFTEQPFEPLSKEQLRVYDATHSFPPQARSATGVYETFTDNCDSDLGLLFVTEDAHRVRVFRSVMFEAVRLLLDARLPSAEQVTAEVVAGETGEGRSVKRLVLSRAGAGEEIPAVLVMPDAWNGTVVVGVSGIGKAEFFEGGTSSLAGAAGVVDAGAAFLAPDVLLTGEYRDVVGGDPPRLGIDEKRHGTDVGFTYSFNRTLLAERVNDILTAVAYARSLEGVKRVNLVGTGMGGPWVLMARAVIGDLQSAGDAVERTAVQATWSFDFVHSFQDENFLPGALRYGGLSYFAALIAPAELRFAGNADESAPIVIPEIIFKAYRSLDMMAKVGSVGNRRYGELVGWLAEPSL